MTRRDGRGGAQSEGRTDCGVRALLRGLELIRERPVGAREGATAALRAPWVVWGRWVGATHSLGTCSTNWPETSLAETEPIDVSDIRRFSFAPPWSKL